MNGTKYKTEGLTGEKGLILAIIATAESDVIEGNGHSREAKLYFESDWYRQHLDWLGLQPGTLPERLKTVLTNDK